MMNRNIFFIPTLALFLLALGACSSKQAKSKELTVGVYSGGGSSSTCILETLEALKIDGGIEGIALSPSDILNGSLNHLDVVIFPGGSGSKEYLSMGNKAQEKVRDFVLKEGKGVVGICAGAFLLSNTDGYPSLKLSTAKVTDRPHYNRGRGLVEVKMMASADEVFPEIAQQNVFLQYYDGPLLVPSEDGMVYDELAQFLTDIRNRSSIPENISPGKSFILKERRGNGKLFLIAGHPESTPGMRWMVPRMARWVANAELISYANKWVRPEINDSAIVFVSELAAYEKSNFWTLCDGSAAEKIEAMDRLYNIRSRPAVRWNIGLLRDENAAVRTHAAELLMQCEYTDALKDLETALVHEEDENTRNKMQEAIEFLTTF